MDVYPIGTVREAFEYVADWGKGDRYVDAERLGQALWILEMWVNGIKKSSYVTEVKP